MQVEIDKIIDALVRIFGRIKCREFEFLACPVKQWRYANFERMVILNRKLRYPLWRGAIISKDRA